MANISEFTLPNGATYTLGTAATAKKLFNGHAIDTTATAGWYKFFEISMAVFTRQTIVICIESTYNQQCSILRINTYRTSSGAANQSIGWIAAGSRHHTVRWEYSSGVWSFYIYKNDDINTLVFQILARNNDTYGVWSSTKVSEPTSAIEVDTIVDVQARFAVSDGNGNNIADGALRFDAVTILAGTAQQILSISNAKITADYVLARIEFADPLYITTGYSWETNEGSFTLTGTATAATTANVLLIRKGN